MALVAKWITCYNQRSTVYNSKGCFIHSIYVANITKHISFINEFVIRVAKRLKKTGL